MLKYTLLVTGPAYGTQQSSSAFQFAQALLAKGHKINTLFFYNDGVTNANQLTFPANDEFDLVKAWVNLSVEYEFPLQVCIAASWRRGIISLQDSEQHVLPAANLQPGFSMSGLGALAEALLISDRLIQF